MSYKFNPFTKRFDYYPALDALLPSQAGQGGKVLGTDGTNGGWVAASGGGLTPEVITTDKAIATGKLYVCNSVSQLVLTLPATMAAGFHFGVQSLGAGGFQIKSNASAASQRIDDYNHTSAGSATSNITLAQSYGISSYIELVCVTENAVLQVMQNRGVGIYALSHDGALVHFTFDNVVGTDVIDDIHGIPAAITGATEVSGIDGNARNFASDQYLTVAKANYRFWHDFSEGNPSSGAAWINVTNQNEWQCIFGIGTASPYLFHAENGSLSFSIIEGWSGNFLRKAKAGVLVNGTTYHVGYTYDGSSSIAGIKIYLNGIELTDDLTTNNTLAGSFNSDFDLVIGNTIEYTSHNYLNGWMDELWIFGRELTAMEMSALYGMFS